MFVIVKQSFLFQKDTVAEHPVSHERMQVVEDSFKVIPNERYTPQFVPDWVRETDLFKLAEKDGSIVETVKAPPTEDEKEEESQRKQPAGPRGATGLHSGHQGWKK